MSEDPAEIEVEARRRLPHPRERVFDALADPEERAAWLPGWTATARGAGVPPAPASAWRESRVLLGAPVEEGVEVVSAERPGALRLRIDGIRGTALAEEYTIAWTLESDGDATILSCREEGRGLGRRGRLTARFLAWPFRRALEEELDALEAHLAGSGGESPAPRVGKSRLPPPAEGV